jgi:signal transduction histidine kinase
LAERIDEEIEERRADSDIIAGVRFVSWFLEALVSDTPDPLFGDDVGKLFDDQVISRKTYDYIIALSLEGRVVATNSVYADGASVPAEIREDYWGAQDFFGEAWFQQALNEGRSSIDFHRLDLSSLGLGEATPLAGGWYVGFVRRVEKWPLRPVPDVHPEPAGVLLTLMSWSNIQEKVNSHSRRHLREAGDATMGNDIYGSSYAWVWKSDADTIIAHPDRDLYGKRVTELDQGALRKMSQAATHADWGMYPDYVFRGEVKKAAFARCRSQDDGGFGWVVGVGVDFEDIWAPVQELSNWLFTTSAVILALAVLFTFWIAHRTTRPIRDLEQMTRRVGLGDLDARIEVRSGDELGQLAASFNRMTQELKTAQDQLVKVEKDAAWREMARQVAHEIKNPLTPISLSAGLLKRSWDEKSPEFESILGRTIEMIQRQVENMRDVARDFYAFAGEHRDPRPVPISLLLEEVLELNAAWAEDRGVVLHAPEALGLMVRADPDELQRALLNLAANAIDAMPDGGDLFVTVDREGDEVVIELRDTGTGIDPAVAEQLFQPYFTTRSSGTGLGLAIVRRVIEDLGGRVELANTPGAQGATARVSLPLVG